MTDWKNSWRLIKADVTRKTLSDGRPLRFSSLFITALSPSVAAVVLFRLQRYFYFNDLYIISKVIAQLNILLFSVEIGSRCQAAGGLILGHANGIVIHDQVIIGRNCTLMHQTGIGLNYRPGISAGEQFVVLEDEVFVGAGARILGPGVIGKGSRIGMNAVVSGSFPERSVIAGLPAGRLRTLEKGEDFPPEPVNRNYGNRKALSLADTFGLIAADLRHRAHVDGRPFTRRYYAKLFFSPPAMAVFIFRWAAFFDRRSIRWAAKILSTVNIIVFKTDIGGKAEIEGGFVIGHANGVIINNQAKIGKNAVFFHHNTVAIGPRAVLSSEIDRVVIGDNFMAGAGARILGNITIGDNCIAAMNAVVTRSAPDNTVLAGIPARAVEKKRDQLPRKAGPEKRLPPPVAEKPTLLSVWSVVRQDIERRAAIEGKPGKAFYYLKVLVNPPAMAVVFFRLANYFIRTGCYPPAKILAIANNLLFSVDIQPLADIGPGFVLAHANGILIHDKTIIGKNCIMTLQNTITIGPRDDLDPENDRTIIGDNALIGMGARIIGNITLGHSVTIGANAVVTKSAPNMAVLVGVPAVDRNAKAAAGMKKHHQEKTR